MRESNSQSLVCQPVTVTTIPTHYRYKIKDRYKIINCFAHPLNRSILPHFDMTLWRHDVGTTQRSGLFRKSKFPLNIMYVIGALHIIYAHTSLLPYLDIIFNIFKWYKYGFIKENYELLDETLSDKSRLGVVVRADVLKTNYGFDICRKRIFVFLQNNNWF